MVGTVGAARHRNRVGAAFAAGLLLGAAAVFTALAALGLAVGGHAVPSRTLTIVSVSEPAAKPPGVHVLTTRLPEAVAV